MGKKISQLDAITTAGIDEPTDLVAVFDTTANKLKKISVEDFLELAPGFDIASLPNLSPGDVQLASDKLVVFDASAGAAKVLFMNDFQLLIAYNIGDLASIAVGDIVEATDLIAIHDANAGVDKSVSVQDFLTLAGGGGLTNWTESAAGSGTNTRSKFLATGAETNIDAVVAPKGNGAFRTNDDSGSCGTYAVDLQLQRNSVGQVASGPNAVICGGLNNTASGNNSSITGGEENYATNNYCRAGGLWAVASRQGEDVWSSGPYSGFPGDAQAGRVVMSREVTGTSATEIFVNDLSGARFGILANQAIHVIANVVAKTSDAGDGTGATGDVWAASYTAAIKRISNTTSIIGTPGLASTVMADATMSDAALIITADDTWDSLKFEFDPPSTAGSTSTYIVVIDVQYVQLSQ